MSATGRRSRHEEFEAGSKGGLSCRWGLPSPLGRRHRDPRATVAIIQCNGEGTAAADVRSWARRSVFLPSGLSTFCEAAAGPVYIARNGERNSPLMSREWASVWPALSWAPTPRRGPDEAAPCWLSDFSGCSEARPSIGALAASRPSALPEPRHRQNKSSLYDACTKAAACSAAKVWLSTWPVPPLE
jgi:hypothetical protein